MRNLVLILLLAVWLFSGCQKANNTQTTQMTESSCEQSIIINSKKYSAAKISGLVIDQLEIKGNCLKVVYSSSGCSGDTWELTLIDEGEVIEDSRNLVFSLKNEEMCEAYITKETTFDLSPLQISKQTITLQILNTKENLIYKY